MAPAALLEKPTFVGIGDGRVRCVETGHELPEAQKEQYAASKGCSSALFDLALARGRPPLNYFEQSTTSKDRVYCKLTGVLVNKNEASVWKHVLGKKFSNKLSDEEEKVREPEKSAAKDDQADEPKKKKKKTTNKDTEMDQDVKSEKKKKKVHREDDNQAQKPKKTKKVKKTTDSGPKTEMEIEDEEPEFWMPPERAKSKKNKGVDDEQSDSGTDGMEEDGEDFLGDIETEIRLKRTALAVGPSGSASRKKKRKT